MSKLLHNLPIEHLTKENDYLGVIDKANFIQTILESNIEQFHEIKMFALYGEWGSGKSTLMKYLECNLKENFNTFFFDTWQFEKDDNLPQTLLEFLLNKTESAEEEFYGNILKYGGKLLRGLGKSVKIKVPLYPQGPSIDINPSELMKEFEKEDISFYKALENFKIEFVRWEDNITKKKDKKYNIIFIDDLDRCEPENVLNLLSAVKLFFTYGKKTIFFFGVDKKAIQQAIQTKYKDVVKSEEYLEKIFDISFSMPEHDNILKLVSTYFGNKFINKEKLDEKIAIFFKQLRFTNPRRVKKVLNKYLLLAKAKDILGKNHYYTKYVGHITTTKYRRNYFETILSLYLIAVKEFHPKLFKNLFDFKIKENTLKIKCLELNEKSGSSRDYWNSVKGILPTLLYNTSLDKIFNTGIIPDKARGRSYSQVTLIFCPENITSLDEGFDRHDKIYEKIHLIEKKIDYYFLEYLCTNIEFFNRATGYSDKSISDIYQGIKQIL